MKLHDQTPFLITRSHQDIPVYQYNLRCITFHYQVKSPSRFIKNKETKKNWQQKLNPKYSFMDKNRLLI